MAHLFWFSLVIYLRICITLEMTVSTKTINKGTIPILSAMINLNFRLEDAGADISFTTNSATKTMMPIRASEAASTDIVKVKTVDVVITGVMIDTSLWYCTTIFQFDHTVFIPMSQFIKMSVSFSK